MAAAPVVFLRRLAFVSSAVELAASVPAAAAAPPPSMTVLAPVARPPVARLLVVPKLSSAWFAWLIRSRCPTTVALHAPREIHVRTFRALPVAVSYSRGRRAGPPAPVRRLCLRLRCGRLLDEDRVPREVWCFPHPGRPITRSSPVGHGLLVASFCQAERGSNGARAAIGQRLLLGVFGSCCHAWACAAASTVGALRLAGRLFPAGLRGAM